MPKRTIGKAGVGVRRMELRWLAVGLSLCAVGLIFAWLMISGKMNGLGFGGLIAALAALAAFVAVLEHIDKRTSQMDRGAAAEEVVERALASLPGSCNVVHDVVLPSGRGNIDHVVLAPAGIFTIETKSHKGTVTFEGSRLLLNGHPFEKDFLSQAYAEAMGLKDYLLTVSSGEAHFVQPVIVFTRGFVKMRGKAKGVKVVPLKWLPGEITNGGSRISAEKREAITNSLQHLTAEARLRRA